MLCCHWHCSWSLLMILTVCRWEVSYLVAWGDTVSCICLLWILAKSVCVRELICDTTLNKLGWQREWSSPVRTDAVNLPVRGKTPCLLLQESWVKWSMSWSLLWLSQCGLGMKLLGHVLVEVLKGGLCSCYLIWYKRQWFRLPDTWSTRSYRKTGTQCIQLPQTWNEFRPYCETHLNTCTWE